MSLRFETPTLANRRDGSFFSFSSYFVAIFLLLSSMHSPSSGFGHHPASGGHQGQQQTLSACAEDGSDYYYNETIVGSERRIVTTFCPNHPFYSSNSTFPVKQMTEYSVPAYPRFSRVSTNLTQRGGSIGVLFNGAGLFSPCKYQSWMRVPL